MQQRDSLEENLENQEEKIAKKKKGCGGFIFSAHLKTIII